MQKETPDKLLTASEIAKRYSIKPRTVREWASNGWIEKVRFGRRCVRYPLASLEALVSSRTEKGRYAVSDAEREDSG